MRTFIHTHLTGIRAIHSVPILACALFLLSLTGCEENPTENQNYNPEPVLTAYIETEQPMSTVHFEWTGAFERRYNREALGILNARIVIYPVTDSSQQPVDSTEKAVYFEDNPGTRGLYQAVNPAAHLPASGWTYRIVADHPDLDATVWGETTAPDTFALQVISYPELTPPQTQLPELNQEDPTIQLEWTPSLNVGGFLLNITCIEHRDSLIYLDPGRWEREEEEDNIQDQYYISPLRSDQSQMNIPWLMFRWRGMYEIGLMSASHEYYRYVFTLQNETEGGEYHRIEDNIENGLGIFGAISYQHFYIEMVPVGK